MCRDAHQSCWGRSLRTQHNLPRGLLPDLCWWSLSEADRELLANLTGCRTGPVLPEKASPFRWVWKKSARMSVRLWTLPRISQKEFSRWKTPVLWLCHTRTDGLMNGIWFHCELMFRLCSCIKWYSGEIFSCDLSWSFNLNSLEMDSLGVVYVLAVLAAAATAFGEWGLLWW